MISSRIIADSINAKGTRLTTFELRYQRFIHSELMTHRVFSRSAASSRAIPIMKQLKQVWKEPAMPLHWGKNQSGMQAKKELSSNKIFLCQMVWIMASKFACVFAYLFSKIGLHKQIGNRILEPFTYIDVIVTSTEWENFFALRAHKDAQPEFRHLAELMQLEYNFNKPSFVRKGQWHLPYIDRQEKEKHSLYALKQMSAARCARVSFANHDGSDPDPEKDLKTFYKLSEAVPIHASPMEHQATPSGDKNFHRNFRGWKQFREEVEEEILEFGYADGERI